VSQGFSFDLKVLYVSYTKLDEIERYYWFYWPMGNLE
jgi:hypothetical protein